MEAGAFWAPSTVLGAARDPVAGAGCCLGSSFVKCIVLGAGAAEPQVRNKEREEQGAEGETGDEKPIFHRVRKQYSCVFP